MNIIKLKFTFLAMVEIRNIPMKINLFLITISLPDWFSILIKNFTKKCQNSSIMTLRESNGFCRDPWGMKMIFLIRNLGSVYIGIIFLNSPK